MFTPKPVCSSESTIVFRLARPEDEPLLFSFFRDAREEDFALLGWDEALLTALLRQQFDAQHTAYAARFPGAEQRIAMISGQPVALLWVWRSSEEIRLLDFIVSADRRNLGIGTRLLRLLQQEAADAALPLRHMVAVTNERAKHLYLRLSFAVAGDTGSHLLMEWRPEAEAAG